MTKTALITGASSGIGLEFAKLLAKEKYDLIIVARSSDKLEKISKAIEKDFGVKVRVILKDLSENNSANEIFDELISEKVIVDIMINNAGFGSYGPFAESDLNNDLEMIRLNISSLVVFTNLFLREMLKRNSGRIMNVASTAAFQPGPYMALYYASKAFVLSFSEAVAEEISDSKVTISCLCPGPVKTGFQGRAGLQKAKLANKNLLGMITAEEVAKIGYKGLMKGKRIIIPGKLNWLVAKAVNFTPRRLVTKIGKYIHSE